MSAERVAAPPPSEHCCEWCGSERLFGEKGWALCRDCGHDEIKPKKDAADV